MAADFPSCIHLLPQIPAQSLLPEAAAGEAAAPTAPTAPTAAAPLLLPPTQHGSRQCSTWQQLHPWWLSSNELPALMAEVCQAAREL
jgi:hypothetical protein